MTKVSCLFSLILLSATTVALANQPPPVLEIGQPAPDFTLPGVDGKKHSLEDFAEAELLVVMFTCNHCPDARAAAPRMAELYERYAGKGVAFVAISGNDPKALRPDELGYGVYGDSFPEMKPFAEKNGWQFPYLYDGDTQKVISAYGGQATPHVFIFDEDRLLRYNGRIDDMKRRSGPLGESYVVDAIDALLAGEEVENKTTRAFGCSTKWSYKRDSVAKDQARWEAIEEKLALLDAEAAKSLAANTTDKLRIVNFWSTTCGPCVVEFPDLVETYRRFQNRPVELITVSLDPLEDKGKALKFLEKQHAALSPRTAKSVQEEGRTTNNYLFDGNPDHLAEAFDPDWGGAMPHTLIIAPGGELLWRHSGMVEPVELRSQVVKWLERKR
ncbi:redoxin [Coraliomargarita sinensis]|uniref:Redoxin n=1 Tax=Coraliomargarita sinensis TaxID=2174842 RepID=A0A317ZCQ6_9BACT|nr:redoxin domain-containing protein [Coraliomargarita sinensis]PXA02955.1 redoxin [Coraliomargarita sinensis]